MDKIAIFKRLKQHYNRVKEDGYNILFIALQGSQNYDLNDDNSDVDSIAVVLPTLDEISLNQPLVSKNIKLDNNDPNEYNSLINDESKIGEIEYTKNLIKRELD